jgi:hypothetical protein
VDVAGTTVGVAAGDTAQALNRKKNTINFNIFCIAIPPPISIVKAAIHFIQNPHQAGWQ